MQQQTKELIQSDSYVPAQSSGSVSIHTELTTAEYALTPLELKTWFIVISSLKDLDVPMYAMSVMKIADSLGIDQSKGRGGIVYEIFQRLSDQKISIRSQKADKCGERGGYTANFIGEVYYDNTSKIICFSIPVMLHKYLFHLEKSLSLTIDLKDILLLDTVVSIRIFIYLRGLERRGIKSVTVEEFRKNIDFYPTSPYKEYKRKVIKSSIAEIRKHLEYKDFYIEDDGKPGRKAEHILFGFENQDATLEMFKKLKPSVRKEILDRFSKKMQILIAIAMEAGFDPSYIKHQFDNVSDQRIEANFEVVFDRIHADRMRNQGKQPEEYGRYFIKAVVNDWAGERFDELSKKSENRIRNHGLPEKIREANEQEQFLNMSSYARQAAKDYIDEMKPGDLLAFIKKYQKEISTLAAKGRPFDENRALEGKKTYREYRLLCRLVSGKMISGEIPMPTPKLQSLF